jgi:hypothetical protein
MPQLRRRRLDRRPDLTDLKPGQLRELETGQSYIRYRGDGPRPDWPGGMTGFGDDFQSLKTAWKIHGAEIVEEFIRDHAGHRPFCWWWLEHRRERPLVQDMEPRRVDALRRETWNFLHNDTFQEPEESYLRRNGLLTEAEEKALAKKGEK